MNKLLKECLIACILIVIVPQAILFIVKTIQTDETKFENQYFDFIKSYMHSHAESINPELNAEIAWRKSELYTTSNHEYQNVIVINYFKQLIIQQIALLVLIYLGCVATSSIIAAACIISALLTYLLLPAGMGGLLLWYGIIIEFICACIALSFLLKFLYRQSKK
jgi:hypothetical protein